MNLNSHELSDRLIDSNSPIYYTCYIYLTRGLGRWFPTTAVLRKLIIVPCSGAAQQVKLEAVQSASSLRAQIAHPPGLSIGPLGLHVHARDVPYMELRERTKWDRAYIFKKSLPFKQYHTKIEKDIIMNLRHVSHPFHLLWSTYSECVVDFDMILFTSST